MKTLHQSIEAYTKLLQDGDLQLAYRSILEFMGKWRAQVIKTHPEHAVSSLYQGYLDMSYFSLTPQFLKDQGLKLALVYLHEKGCFEVWLCARNREIAASFAPAIRKNSLSEGALFHDPSNTDAILEYTLQDAPDFGQQQKLLREMEQGVAWFIGQVERILES